LRLIGSAGLVRVKDMETGVLLGDVAIDRCLQIDDRLGASVLSPATVGAEKDLSIAFSHKADGGEVKGPARMARIIVAAGTASSTACRERIKSWCRWRGMQWLTAVAPGC
jgi:hypothetical protein